jgi:hypothetical protein
MLEVEGTKQSKTGTLRDEFFNVKKHWVRGGDGRRRGAAAGDQSVSEKRTIQKTKLFCCRSIWLPPPVISVNTIGFYLR